MTASAVPIRFSIAAARSPQVLGRMLDYFARVAHETDYVIALARGDELRIAIGVCGLDERTATIIVEKMRADVEVAEARVAMSRTRQ